MADKLHSLICPVKVWLSLRFMADTHNSVNKRKTVEVFGCGMFVGASGRNLLCNCIINLSSCCPLTPWLDD